MKRLVDILNVNKSSIFEEKKNVKHKILGGRVFNPLERGY